MDIHGSAAKIHKRLESHIKHVQNIQQRCNGETKVALQALFCELAETRNEAEEMISQINSEKFSSDERRKLLEKIKVLEEKEKKYQHQLDLLEKKVAQMMKENENFKTQLDATQTQLAATQSKMTKLESALHTRQMAYDFENDLAKYIYPPTEKYGSRQIFKKMRRWVNKEEDTPGRSEAKAKWEDLKTKCSWLDEYNEVFDELVKSGIKIAHPAKVDSATALTSRSELEKGCIEAMMRMIETVNELMK